MKYKKIINLIKAIFFSICIFTSNTACKKFIEVDAPFTSTNSENVYSNDATAAAVLTDIYASMSNANIQLSSQGIINISLFAGLSADELSLYNLNSSNLIKYYRNSLDNLTTPSFWIASYPIIYAANAAIEGCEASVSLSENVKKQLIGEAKFIRAFYYFYLVNLYGDVPLVITTDYSRNSLLARTPVNQVYDQIVQDLNDAEGLLSDNFLAGDIRKISEERVRPTKWAACALLSRVYLFTGDYDNSIVESTKVIKRTSQFSLVDIKNVFLKNSLEAIWQLQSVGIDRNSNTGDGAMFILPDTGPNTGDNPVYLAADLVDDFEPNDKRRINWIDSVIVNGTIYHYAFKYKIPRIRSDNLENIMVMRLSEQFLIRSEAYAKIGKSAEAIADLNTIRKRAGLINLYPASKEDLLSAILHERRVEVFTEMGHRWLDLKRSGLVDKVMKENTKEKGGNWSTDAKLYPLPLSDLLADPNLIQNAGY